MSTPTVTITCACCRRRGLHKARGLRTACYPRHHDNGTLAQYPTTRELKEPWAPHNAHGKRMLARYVELASQGRTAAQIAWELGVGERTVQRYAAAYAAQQSEQAQWRVA
ncbi:hypothetical protein AB0B89_23775 [Sphaerisporangium sp. NPDC049002]|uniref:hypothetical protein n=1 Tax=Sphaerisporangium sp. NPDC049002 TaxID=3155392 RepID=UPI0033E887AF